jgi:elongation factor G
MAGQPSQGTRVIALVGPAGAGKTSLAEAMLFAAGATDRLGSTANGSSIGDSSPEARQRGGSTELNLYNFEYLGDSFALVDCPGSVGFAAEGAKALARTSSSSIESTRPTAESATSSRRSSR